MPIPTQISPASALLGPCPHWPRWKAAKVTAAFSYSLVDTTYNNSTGPSGTSDMQSGGGEVTQDRWKTPRGEDPLTAANMLFEEGQISLFSEEGGLYTAKGALTFEDRIEGPPIVGSVSVGLNWEIHPPIPVPPGPVLGRLARGRSDPRTHRMPCPLSGLGAVFSWGAGSTNITTPEQTILSERTDFEDIIFNLEALTSEVFTWNKTLSNSITYTPGPDDPGTGYYPTRGAITLTASASCVLEFIV